MNNRLNLGLLGLGITLGINLASLFLLSHPSAIFFSANWWTVWLPAYLVWSIITVTGIGREIKRRFEFIIGAFLPF